MQDEPRTEEWLDAVAGLALAHGRWCHARRLGPDACPHDPEGTLLERFFAFHWFAGWIGRQEGQVADREPRWAAFTGAMYVGLVDLRPDE